MCVGCVSYSAVQGNLELEAVLLFQSPQCYVDQIGQELRGPPASASRVVGLKVCTICLALYVVLIWVVRECGIQGCPHALLLLQHPPRVSNKFQVLGIHFFNSKKSLFLEVLCSRVWL